MNLQLNTDDNKRLIWTTLLDAGQFNGISQQHKPSVTRYVEETINRVNVEYGNKMNLMELNKRVIFDISQYIKKIKNTSSTETKTRVDTLNEGMMRQQNERSLLTPNNKPHEIDFTQPKEDLDASQMDKQYAKMMADRDTLDIGTTPPTTNVPTWTAPVASEESDIIKLLTNQGEQIALILSILQK
jgi:hypothetical protein